MPAKDKSLILVWLKVNFLLWVESEVGSLFSLKENLEVLQTDIAQSSVFSWPRGSLQLKKGLEHGHFSWNEAVLCVYQLPKRKGTCPSNSGKSSRNWLYFCLVKEGTGALSAGLGSRLSLRNDQWAHCLWRLSRLPKLAGYSGTGLPRYKSLQTFWNIYNWNTFKFES